MYYVLIFHKDSIMLQKTKIDLIPMKGQLVTLNCIRVPFSSSSIGKCEFSSVDDHWLRTGSERGRWKNHSLDCSTCSGSGSTEHKPLCQFISPSFHLTSIYAWTFSIYKEYGTGIEQSPKYSGLQQLYCYTVCQVELLNYLKTVGHTGPS